MNIPSKHTSKIILLLYSAMVLSFFFQSLTWGTAYRIFAYLTLLLSIGVCLIQAHKRDEDERKVLLKCLLPLVTLVGLEWVATSHFPWDIKLTRHALLATGLMAGVVLMARNQARLNSYFVPTLIFAVYTYTLFQCVFIYMLGHKYGTTKNPHYLAIYSALFFVLAVFLAINWSRGMHRYALILSALILGSLLLNTSSRPTWIALIVAILIGVVCLRSQTRVMLIGLIAAFLLIFFTDAGDFKTRMGDLVVHARTEERVTIWEDTWAMQQSSNRQQWLLGHGVEGFEHDFQPYSRDYARAGLAYNSPHNAILEVLYLYGVTGLLAVLSFILWLYYALLSRYMRYRHQATHPMPTILILLLMLLTIDLVTVSITLPFFVSINLNVIALVMGIIFYLDRRYYA